MRTLLTTSQEATAPAIRREVDSSGRNPRRRTALGNAYQDSGANPRRRTALGNAYQDNRT
ncbi:hypothetical protein [Synechococcus sp. PCC 7335]|uniref:hypothetical protein n=1 Tax=Synechococcus sp. (strain ATCC 29403 / PCC 7335) TaxID=91464 RepID=UPI00057004C7|nr:hypothetical protein [Synechococcus sp. PCC 7335]